MKSGRSEPFVLPGDPEEAVAFASNLLARTAGAIGSEDPQERVVAAVRLSRMRFGPGESDLAEVGGTALAGLGERCLDLLIPYLGDDDEALRVMAVSALRVLRDKARYRVGDIVVYLDKYPFDTMCALLAIGDAAIPSVLEVMRCGRRPVRLAGLKAIEAEGPVHIDMRLAEYILGLMLSSDSEARRLAEGALDSLAACDVETHRILERQLPSLDANVRDRVAKILDEHAMRDD